MRWANKIDKMVGSVRAMHLRDNGEWKYDPNSVAPIFSAVCNVSCSLGKVKKVATWQERELARLQAELRATDKRHQDAMITKETTEFIVKRITKVVDTLCLLRQPPCSVYSLR